MWLNYLGGEQIPKKLQYYAYAGIGWCTQINHNIIYLFGERLPKVNLRKSIIYLVNTIQEIS